MCTCSLSFPVMQTALRSCCGCPHPARQPPQRPSHTALRALLPVGHRGCEDGASFTLPAFAVCFSLCVHGFGISVTLKLQINVDVSSFLYKAGPRHGLWLGSLGCQQSAGGTSAEKGPWVWVGCSECTYSRWWRGRECRGFPSACGYVDVPQGSSAAPARCQEGTGEGMARRTGGLCHSLSPSLLSNRIHRHPLAGLTQHLNPHLHGDEVPKPLVHHPHPKTGAES